LEATNGSGGRYPFSRWYLGSPFTGPRFFGLNSLPVRPGFRVSEWPLGQLMSRSRVCFPRPFSLLLLNLCPHIFSPFWSSMLEAFPALFFCHSFNPLCELIGAGALPSLPKGRHFFASSDFFSSQSSLDANSRMRFRRRAAFAGATSLPLPRPFSSFSRRPQ